MQAQLQMTDSALSPEAARKAIHGHTCSAGAPFARITMGSNRYEIADAISEDALLAFRAEGQTSWTALDRSVADGWVKIAADILLIDPDVIFEFLHTHAIRTSATEGIPCEMDFDTFGKKWSARLLVGGIGEVRFGNEPWKRADLGPKAPPERRTRAILTLLACEPDSRHHFEPQITEWARRIATGVSVQPVF